MEKKNIELFYHLKNNILYKYKYLKNKILELNKNTELQLLIVDNFYTYPDKVRDFALSQEFNITGKFPGKSTKSFSNENIKIMFQKHLEPYGVIENFYIDDFSEPLCGIEKPSYDNCKDTSNVNRNGSFNMTNSNTNKSWIHTDLPYDYSAVIYLNPNAPINSGTIFYEGIDSEFNDNWKEYNNDKTKWKKDMIVGNIYNRLIIFNAKKFHCPDEYFGKDNKDESRLIQVFWFNLNNKNKTSLDYIADKGEVDETYGFGIRPPSYNMTTKININQKTKIIVLDNFYKYPDVVRIMALSKNMDNTGNYPGKRSERFLSEEIKKKMELILKPYGNIKLFGKNTQNSNGCFQITTSRDRSWIHCDDIVTNWASVLFLTPYAPKQSGLNLYKLKNSFELKDIGEYSQDVTKWDWIDSIGNNYNRLVLFDSQEHHMSGDYFGTDDNNARLTQVFFINVE